MSGDGSAYTVGVVGARGHAGAELLRIVAAHPRLEMAFAWSRALAGRETPIGGRFESPEPGRLRDTCPDVLVLAMPNGAAGAYVEAAGASGRAPRVIVDLSADYRFDDGWVYGLSEHFRDRLRGAALISNPGCYATALQLAVRPLLGMLAGPAHCFGVSGYSGAGTTPSDRNDPEKLRDNLMPYALTGHLHEREATRGLGAPVRFSPSVASFFRGIMMCVQVELSSASSVGQIVDALASAYAGCPLVRVVGERAPSLGEVVNTASAVVGGVSVDERDPTRAAVVCAIDNLCKGASSQAIQNVNLALGMEETMGLAP